MMTVLKVTGAFLIAVGIIWGLQGLGVLNWPPSSFMIAQREWTLYGTFTALIGAATLWWAMQRQRG
jgi:hypothetical protein